VRSAVAPKAFISTSTSFDVLSEGAIADSSVKIATFLATTSMPMPSTHVMVESIQSKRVGSDP